MFREIQFLPLGLVSLSIVRVVSKTKILKKYSLNIYALKSLQVFNLI